MPNPIDIIVGRRLRQRRLAVGMTQQRLAAALNLSFQQIQKYERGINRISAGRLYQLSRHLDVTISYFFETVTPATDDQNPPAPNGKTERETQELALAFSHITDSAVRKRLLEVARAMARYVPSA